MKDYKLKLGSYAPRIHWVGRGTGTPKRTSCVKKKFICNRIKKRRKPRVKIVTLKLC